MTSANIKSSRACPAFTLIELLLVLLLIAISVTTITPRLGESVAGWQAKESSKGMAAAVRLARQLARTSQEIVLFAVDVDKASFVVKKVNSSVDARGTSDDLVVLKQSLGKDVKIAQIEGFRQMDNVKGLVFWPDGTTNVAEVILTARGSSGTAEWHILVDDDGSTVFKEVLADK